MAQYIWPVPRGTSINQPFGSAPESQYNPPGGHTGTDFGAKAGTPLYAPAAGVIEYAQWFTTDNGADNPYWITSGGGISVVLGCDGNDSPSFVFSHLDYTELNPGDRVKQGDVIGYSGNTGKWTTGQHLHFEAIPPGFNLNSPTYGRVNPARYCTGYWGDILKPLAGKPKPITPKPEEGPEVKYQRLYPKPVARRLGMNAPWFLKSEANNFRNNENYACLGNGHYGIDLFVQGYGLPEGESVEVQFYVITKGKRSGYFSQKINGSKGGEFKGNARFSMPVKGSTVEASIQSSTDTTYLNLYGAEIVQATV